MAKIRFENGVTVNFEGNPTQQDIDEISKSIGTGSENPNATKGVLDAFVKGFKNVGTSIKESGEAINPILENQNISSVGKVAGVTGKLLKPFAQIGAEVVATPLRMAGEVAENVTGKDVNEGTANMIGKLIEKGMNTETAQKAIQAYEELKQTNPEAANAIGAALDIADFATLAAGGAKAGQLGFRGVKATGSGVASTVAKGVEEVAKAGEKAGNFADMVKNIGSGAIEKAGEFTGKTDVATDEAVKRFKENLLNQIEGKSSSIKKLDKTRTDILDTIAKNPNYHPDIDPENKTFNVGKAVQNMDADISSYSEELGGLFKTVDAMDGGVPANTVVGDIMSKLLTPKNAPKFIVGGKSFLNDIQGLVDRMSSIYGDYIPREAIWEIRKQIDQSVEQLSDTNVKKSLRTDVRKAFANSLENSIQGGESDLVKRGMAEIGKVIEARDYTRDVLQGFKIQGGKLTDLIRNQTATQTGAILGGFAGNIFAGPVGALGAYVASNKIGAWLAKNALTNAADRKALINLVKERPAVFDEIKQYIDGLSGKEKTQATNNIKFLEAPKTGLKELVDGKKKIVNESDVPEGTPGTIPGAIIRLGKKTESASLRDRIDAIKEQNKPKVAEPTIMTKKDLEKTPIQEGGKIADDISKAKASGQSFDEWVKGQGAVGDSIGQAMKKEFELEKLTDELSKKANSFSGKNGLVENRTPEYLQVKSELDKAMKEYKSFKSSELGKLVQQERRKFPLEVRMKMLKGEVKTRSQLKAEWDKTPLQEGGDIAKAKASGMSFDEWVKVESIKRNGLLLPKEQGSGAINGVYGFTEKQSAIEIAKEGGFKEVISFKIPKNNFSRVVVDEDIGSGSGIKAFNEGSIAYKGNVPSKWITEIQTTDGKILYKNTANFDGKEVYHYSQFNKTPLKTRSQLKAEWDKTPLQEGGDIAKAKASGQSFDERVKGQGDTLYHGTNDISWVSRGEKIKKSESSTLGNPGVFFTKDTKSAGEWVPASGGFHQAKEKGLTGGVVKLTKTGSNQFNLKKMSEAEYEDLWLDTMKELRANPEKFGKDKYGVHELAGWEIVEKRLQKKGYDGVDFGKSGVLFDPNVIDSKIVGKLEKNKELGYSYIPEKEMLKK